jgi:hypothetical protein
MERREMHTKLRFENVKERGHLNDIGLDDLSIHIAPTWSIGHPGNVSFHSSFLILRESVGLLGRGISTTQGHHLHRINANIHALSGIRTHDPSVRADEYIFIP